MRGSTTWDVGVPLDPHPPRRSVTLRSAPTWPVRLDTSLRTRDVEHPTNAEAIEGHAPDAPWHRLET
jgi:hypothetical protein